MSWKKSVTKLILRIYTTTMPYDAMYYVNDQIHVTVNIMRLKTMENNC